jgi:hypothetical protein
MGLSELSHELDIRLVTDAEEQDRQVAGDSVAPQAGLSAPVAGNEAARGAAARIGKENGPGQPSIQLGVDLGGAELAQNESLCVHARSKTRSAIRPSWYFSIRAITASRVSATPVTKSIRIVSSGRR